MVWAPRTAQACSICATAAADRLLPPVLAWAWASIVLYVAASILLAARRGRAKGIPRVGYAVAVTAGFVVLGGLLLGLGLPVLLLAPVGALVVRAFGHRRPDGWSERLSRDARIFRWVVVLVLVALLCLTGWMYMHRSRAEFVLQWEATGPGRRVLHGLASAGKAALPELRILAARGCAETAAEVAVAIGRDGSPPTEVPLLIDVLARLRQEGSGASVTQTEQALASLSGLALPPGSAAAEWRHAWARHAELGKQGGDRQEAAQHVR